MLQLISLAGLHSTAVTMHELATRYMQDGMLAYVELIQQKERELGCDVVSVDDSHPKKKNHNLIVFLCSSNTKPGAGHLSQTS